VQSLLSFRVERTKTASVRLSVKIMPHPFVSRVSLAFSRSLRQSSALESRYRDIECPTRDTKRCAFANRNPLLLNHPEILSSSALHATRLRPTLRLSKDLRYWKYYDAVERHYTRGTYIHTCRGAVRNTLPLSPWCYHEAIVYRVTHHAPIRDTPRAQQIKTTRWTTLRARGKHTRLARCNVPR